jgi:drug/metabolite transporter (DMT)-like permease
MRGADIARLVVLAAVWGASFIFVRALAPVLGPVLTAASRVVIAGVALVAWFRFTGFDADLRRHWRKFLVIGLVNSALPFLLFAFAAVHIPASYSVILNTATPLFAALLSVIWLDERLTVMRGTGLALGAAGVALVTGAGPFVPDAMFGWAIAACLCAALCYALAGIYIKRRAVAVKSMAIAGWSQVFAGAALLPLVPFAPPPGALTPGVIANVLGLALLCSAVAYLLYYRLIADIGPTRAMSVTFLMPLFGMVWSVLFLDETITLPMIAGCALIVGGTALVVRPTHRAAVVAGGAARKT